MNKDEAIAAMESKTPVRLRYATGDWTHGRGVVIAYTDAPTVTVLTPDGRYVSWRADLTEVEELPIHRTEAGHPSCATCEGGGCPDCTDPA